jgi:hypothetical protein
MSETVAPAPDAIADTKELAREVYALARERGAPAVGQKLVRAARVVTDRAEVVAVGTRSVGKSSLLNALVGRPDLLPVDIDVSSNVYVSLGWGPAAPGAEDPGERVRVLFADGREPVETGLDTLGVWASEAGNPHNRRGVSHVRARVQAPLIVDGLTLTDTPGAGGLVAAHGDAVRTACQAADGLLIVLDHVQPVSATVRDFLCSLGDVRRAVFAFNKADTDGATERSIADTRELLAAAGVPHLAAAPMVATSAYLAEEALAEGRDGEPEPELWNASGISSLRDALRAAILEPERREQARTLLAEVGDALRLLAAPDVARLRAGEDAGRVGREAIGELARLRAVDVRRELDRRTAPEWPRYHSLLRRALRSAFNRLEDDVKSGARNLRETLPGKTSGEVNGAWAAAVGPMRSMIIRKAGEVGIGIEVELPETGLPGMKPGTGLPDPDNPAGKGSRFIARLWKAVIKVMMDPLTGPPLALAELGFDTKAAQEIRDRESAFTYLRRERDDMLNDLPEELGDEYRRLAERAIADLESARDERIATLEQVEEALREPPTPEELERSRERVAEVRALDERLRALAAQV